MRPKTIYHRKRNQNRVPPDSTIQHKVVLHWILWCSSTQLALQVARRSKGWQEQSCLECVVGFGPHAEWSMVCPQGLLHIHSMIPYFTDTRAPLQSLSKINIRAVCPPYIYSFVLFCPTQWTSDREFSLGMGCDFALVVLLFSTDAAVTSSPEFHNF